jgi:hypothetical protein
MWSISYYNSCTVICFCTSLPLNKCKRYCSKYLKQGECNDKDKLIPFSALSLKSDGVRSLSARYTRLLIKTALNWYLIRL